MNNKNWIWMVIGCVLPLLFIFLAPAFGIGGGTSLFLFIIFMFAGHLFMPHGSHQHSGHNHAQHNQDKSENNFEISSKKTEEQHKNHNH